MLSFIIAASASAPNRFGASIAEARNTAESAIIPLENRLDALELACASMWELLKATTGLDDAQLMSKIHEVDASDGKVDRKLKVESAPCPSCKRPALVRNARACSWCGADLGKGPF